MYGMLNTDAFPAPCARANTPLLPLPCPWMVDQEVMKAGYGTMLFGVVLLIVTGGCSTYRGATEDNYSSTFGTGPASGSPTMRPGMDSTDVRDPTFLTRRPAQQRWPAVQ